MRLLSGSRRPLPSTLLAAASLTLAAIAATSAHAADVLTFTITQQGANVVDVASGDFDTSGATYSNSGTYLGGIIYPREADTGVGPAGLRDTYILLDPTGTPWATTGAIQLPTSATGQIVLFNESVHVVNIAEGYVSGTSITGSATFDNTNYATIGLTPGVYTYHYGTAGDTIVVDIVPTPEPAGLLLLLTGAAPLAAIARRRLARC